jgi:hypothetical protein
MRLIGPSVAHLLPEHVVVHILLSLSASERRDDASTVPESQLVALRRAISTTNRFPSSVYRARNMLLAASKRGRLWPERGKTCGFLPSR